MHSGRAAELGSRGGRRRTIYSPQGLKDFAPPKTAADLRDLIAQSIVEIRTGKLDPKLANSISYLGTGFLRALEVSDLDSRLRAWKRGRSVTMNSLERRVEKLEQHQFAPRAGRSSVRL